MEKDKSGKSTRETYSGVVFVTDAETKKVWASCGVFIGISALESTCLIWGSTFLAESVGIPADTAAALITFYFIGMTLSRLLSGVLTIKYSDWQIIFSGQAVIFIAVVLLLIQNSVMAATLGLFLIGLGNGPIFPNITHLTPELYSKEASQSIIGIQIAFSYLSVMLTPVLFSVVTTFAGISVFPNFLLVMFLLMIACTIILKIGDAKSRTKRQNV